jgi:peptidoglycan/xylan/chitin deacetylase (PgdA/CDA1 family)
MTTQPKIGNLMMSMRQGESRSVKVLLYHGILSGRYADPFFLGVDEENFRRQVLWLERWGYTSITFEDYNLYLKGELEYLPKKPVIITFDDTDVSVYEIAFPILQDHGMKAVLFVLGDLSVRTNIWDKFQGITAPLVNESQILEMRTAGFEIGSHSLTHRRLTEEANESAWNEIVRSRMSLEILLSEKVETFAYPYGLLNQTVKGMVAEAGYSFACAAYSGPTNFENDLLEIRRIRVKNSSTAIVFWFQLQPAYALYRWAIWRLRAALPRMIPSRKNDKNRPLKKELQP